MDIWTAGFTVYAIIVGIFAFALCRISADADRRGERMRAHSDQEDMGQYKTDLAVLGEDQPSIHDIQQSGRPELRAAG